MMSIGAFAKRVNLTIKAVRLYQEKDLLHPARVDPFTGYRYFDEVCVERAQLIVRLRGFELPLSEIREVLAELPDATGGLVACLERQRARIHARIAQYNHTIRQLDTTLEETVMSQTTFQISQDPSERLERFLTRVHSETHQALNRPLPNITVSSTSGVSGGEAMAAALSHRLAFEAWDEPLLQKLAEDPAMFKAILETLDLEQDAWVENTMGSNIVGDSELFAEGQMNRLLLATAIAAHGGGIFLEMGFHLLLPPDSDRDPESAAFKSGALRLRLVPTPGQLLPWHAKRYEMDEAAAAIDLEERGERLERFAQEAYGKALTDLAYHDLVINSHTLTLYNAVELCVRAYESKFMLDSGWAYVGRG